MMDRNLASTRLTAIMRKVFDEDDVECRDDLTADDVDGWDSLSHVRFLVAVESSFGLRLTSNEMDGFKNIGELLNVIVQRAMK